MADNNCKNCPKFEFEGKKLEDENASLRKQLNEKDAVIISMTRVVESLELEMKKEELKTQNQMLKMENEQIKAENKEFLNELRKKNEERTAKGGFQ